MPYSRQRMFIVAWLTVAAFALTFMHEVSRAVDGSATRQAPPLPEQLSATTRQKPKTRSHRLREGTQIRSEAGYFRLDGDGATFVSDSGHQLGGLANLNLERVVRVLNNAEESQYVRWSVNGTVTEFEGRNFLLITRAIYKSVAQPPVPEVLQ